MTTAQARHGLKPSVGIVICDTLPTRLVQPPLMEVTYHPLAGMVWHTNMLTTLNLNCMYLYGVYWPCLSPLMNTPLPVMKDAC